MNQVKAMFLPRQCLRSHIRGKFIPHGLSKDHCADCIPRGFAVLLTVSLDTNPCAECLRAAAI